MARGFQPAGRPASTASSLQGKRIAVVGATGETAYLRAELEDAGATVLHQEHEVGEGLAPAVATRVGARLLDEKPDMVLIFQPRMIKLAARGDAKNEPAYQLATSLKGLNVPILLMDATPKAEALQAFKDVGVTLKDSLDDDATPMQIPGIVARVMAEHGRRGATPTGP